MHHLISLSLGFLLMKEARTPVPGDVVLIKLADVYESTRQAFKSHGNVINVIIERHSHHKRAQPLDKTEQHLQPKKFCCEQNVNKRYTHSLGNKATDKSTISSPQMGLASQQQ